MWYLKEKLTQEYVEFKIDSETSYLELVFILDTFSKSPLICNIYL